MNQSPPIPFHIKILGWLISLCAFVLGFWQSHLGLKAFKPLGTEYGSFVVAGLIFLLLFVAYERAISGVKIAIWVYLICALFNFTFNLNSFYPNLLGRKLLKEEAIQVNERLQSSGASLDSVCKSFANGSLDISVVARLKGLKGNIINEIGKQAGFGPRATQFLRDFNQLAGSNINANATVGSQKQRDEMVVDYTKRLDEEIKNYIENKTAGNDQTKMQLLELNDQLDSVISLYSPVLKEIITSNETLTINDSTKFHPEIQALTRMVNTHDNLGISVNKSANKPVIALFNNSQSKQLVSPKIQFLGSFEFTIDSVIERINKIDTWGILILVLFIDFLVPISMYYLLRRRQGESSKTDSISDFWLRLLGKKKPQRF